MHFSLDASRTGWNRVTRTRPTKPAAGKRPMLSGRFHPRSRVLMGETIDIAVSVENMHFFDPRTTSRSGSDLGGLGPFRHHTGRATVSWNVFPDVPWNFQDRVRAPARNFSEGENLHASIRRVIPALMVAGLLFAACGSDDDAATDTTAGSSGESLFNGEIPCDQQYAGKTVTIMSPVRNDENSPTTITDFVAGYQPLMDCTGLTIEFQGGDQFETEVNVRLEGGNPPDVIDYPQPGLMRSHIERVTSPSCPKPSRPR